MFSSEEDGWVASTSRRQSPPASLSPGVDQEVCHQRQCLGSGRQGADLVVWGLGIFLACLRTPGVYPVRPG